MEIYVNLHPTYDYANVMVDGYIEELKEYVKLVDWLMWDYTSGKGRPFISVMGENHVEKVYILLQRLQSKADNIYIRDRRADKWSDYKANKIYSDEEMISVEQQIYREPDEWRWAKKDLEKANEYISMVQERGDEPDDFLMVMKTEAEGRMKKIEEDEKKRKDQISVIWKEQESPIRGISLADYLNMIDYD